MLSWNAKSLRYGQNFSHYIESTVNLLLGENPNTIRRNKDREMKETKNKRKERTKRVWTNDEHITKDPEDSNRQIIPKY